MKIVLLSSLAAATALGLLGQGTSNPSLDRLGTSLKDAKSLTASFMVVKALGTPVQCTLTYAKPGMFKIETPDRLTVSDGTTVWDYNKADKSYTEGAAAYDRTVEDDVWAWAGFFAKDPFKDARGIAPGAKRTIKSVQVQELSMTLPSGKTVTLYLDAKTGLTRGASIKKDDADTLTFASEVKTSPDAVPASAFAFTAPAGAKKMEKPKATEVVPFSRVQAIFQASCQSCHQPGGTKGGFDSSTYAGIMAGGRSGKCVVPGDAENSTLLGMLRGTHSPKMPKGGAPLPEDQIKAIENWILGGAKP